MKTFVSVDDARSTVLDHASLQPDEQISYEASRGRTLAAPVVSKEPVPPFDNSAMDGYAVHARDVETPPTRLPIAFEVAAGAAPETPLPPGTCAPITTGGAVPEGADAVIRVERTERTGDTVRFDTDATAGQNIRPAGEDMAAGQTIIDAGTVVTPSAVGVMASLGHTQVTVRCQPRVVVLATGDELVPPNAAPGPGQIRNSNGPLLAQLLHTAGATARTEHAGDDEAALQDVLETARSADALLLTGGMSVGEDDLVRDVLETMGARWLFWKVRQRPGKPFGFGLLDDTLVFGLPGNPVAAAVCFEAYVRPALARMLGRSVVQRPLHAATLTEPLRVKAGYHYFTRGRAQPNDEGCLEVHSAGPQGAGILSSLHRANCLIHLPEDVVDPQPGDRVQIEWLTAGCGNT